MKVIVLAGGLGTRLRSVIKNDTPKPMALIGNKPFLEILFDYLLLQGCTEVIIAVSYLHKKIINYFKYKYKNLKITYSVESKPLGTGGAILQALNYVKENENVFVINGDTFCRVDYKTFCKCHSVQNSNISMVVKKFESPTRYGTVKINTYNKIIDFCNDSTSQEYINCGVYLLNKKIFKGFQLPNKFSFENDFLLPYISKLDILAYPTEEFFIDIGIPEDYEYLNNVLSK